MLPSPEPGKVEDSDTAPLVLVQLRVQVEVQVQQRTVLLKFLLVAEGKAACHCAKFAGKLG